MKDLPAVPKPRHDPDMDNFIYQGKQGRDDRQSPTLRALMPSHAAGIGAHRGRLEAFRAAGMPQSGHSGRRSALVRPDLTQGVGVRAIGRRYR